MRQPREHELHALGSVHDRIGGSGNVSISALLSVERLTNLLSGESIFKQHRPSLVVGGDSIPIICIALSDSKVGSDAVILCNALANCVKLGDLASFFATSHLLCFVEGTRENI